MPSTKKHPTGDHDGGYCRPPKAHQWKKGQSGNPKGRIAAQPLDILASLGRALKRAVPISVDGTSTKMSLMDAMTQRLVLDAAKGVPSARRELLKMLDFVEALENRTKVINARLVFDEEENRMMQVAQENRKLLAEKEALEAELAAQPKQVSASSRSEP